MPSSTTYASLREAATAVEGWTELREGARGVLGARDAGGLVDVLLADGEPDAAWTMASGAVDWDPGELRWMRMAEAREATDPAGALAVYLRLVDGALTTADRRAYQVVVRYLKAAQRAAVAARANEAFDARVGELRELHRRRPSLIAMLDEAGFT
jgi:hypothetical protein